MLGGGGEGLLWATRKRRAWGGGEGNRRERRTWGGGGGGGGKGNQRERRGVGGFGRRGRAWGEGAGRSAAGRGDRRGGGGEEKNRTQGEQNAGGEEIERGRKRAHFGSANATAGTADFSRRTATTAGQMSFSLLLLLPLNLQFRCMNYLVLFAIYKIFLYPLGNNEKFPVLFFLMNIFLLESLRFFLLAYGSVFGCLICIECWFQRL